MRELRRRIEKLEERVSSSFSSGGSSFHVSREGGVYRVECNGEVHLFQSEEEVEAFLSSRGHKGLIVILEEDVPENPIERA